MGTFSVMRVQYLNRPVRIFRNLTSFASDVIKARASYKITCRFICSNWRLGGIFDGSEYVMLLHAVCTGLLIRLYDRWTLQLVNAIRIPGKARLYKLDFTGNSEVIHRHSNKGSTAIFWNQSMGKLHTLMPKSQSFAYLFCVSKLTVLMREDGKH